jgi:hypothetical protein
LSESTLPLFQRGFVDNSSGDFATAISYADCLIFLRSAPFLSFCAGIFYEKDKSSSEYPTGFVKNSPTVVAYGFLFCAVKQTEAQDNTTNIISFFMAILLQ